ncbi:TonB-dependent receptor [Psychrosphaera sp. 1_MG-2023]|uniref:TonB-dependent receptor n=1 Tax=Psychrosphaera sp. 1_MG-2023 TaxID=3062643 RepID=UPI0026E20422|nr:TonB-dependent receptor [Psychrosphaera sp. 1_MG-2023]MDO6718673.1 TonB-dependent receptor [Psychrosphaera sp. 1_MG-2023]
MSLSTNVYSQEEEKKTEAEDNVEVIEVKGMRSNLLNAQNLKRNAETFVDSITSDDIGSLPDRSVLEAMQRLPGVSIERFAASNDPDHFSSEGSGAVVRGMTQTRSEFNGRDSFTADSGRGLSFQDVPPEMMAGVDIYKNQTADMIEGGIAGTISLRTRRPFDQAGRQLAFSADWTRGDIAKETTPTFSGLYSDRWDKGELGEFGFLINFSKSRLEADSHGIQNNVFEFRPLSSLNGMEVANPYIYDGSFAKYAPTGVQIGDEGVLVPTSANLSMKQDTRERTGIATALQWQSEDSSLKATVQFLRSDSVLSWNEHNINSEWQPGDYRAGAIPGTEFEFDDDGVYESGSITDTSGGWRGDAERSPGGEVQNFGFRFNTGNRIKQQRTEVDDISLKVEYTPTDNLSLVFDFQHIVAEKTDDDMKLMFMTHANQNWDTTGSTPNLEMINPWSAATQEEVDAIGVDYRGDNYFNELTSYHFAAAMDHYERSKGVSNALSIDATYSLDSDYFVQLKFGVRRAEREQRVKYSKYNWGSLGALWANPVYLDDPLIDDIAGRAQLGQVHEVVDWSNFFRGGTATIQGGNTALHPANAMTNNYENWGVILEPMYSDRCGDFRPAASRIYEDDCSSRSLTNQFLPQEISYTSEGNTAAYIRLDFENDDWEYRVAGNIGLRAVRIENTTRGTTSFPEQLTQYPAPEGWDPLNYNPEDYNLFATSSRFLEQTINYMSEDFRNFANGALVPNEASQSYTKYLPSFNIKVELTDDLLARFAVSKAIALPDIGNLRNNTTIGVLGHNLEADRLPAYWNAENPHPDAPSDSTTGLPVDASGNDLEQNLMIDPESARINGWTASSGNPFLKPMESVQWDASFEWYYDDVGSLTTSFFYKDLTNFFINGGTVREFTNPETGVTQQVDVSGPTNGGKGSMKGVEINYQQFFDMLPGAWSGLGMQANYTYIKTEGTPNANLDSTDIGDAQDLNQDGKLDDADKRDTNGDGNLEYVYGNVGSESYALQSSLPLQGQSEHTANLILMYEKDDWSARVAYNWRSEYLVTSRDTISKLPVWTGDSGYMDGSIFYQINDQLKIGVQGVNLLNTQTETYMQVDNKLKLHRSWLVNDRRYSFIVRGTF